MAEPDNLGEAAEAMRAAQADLDRLQRLIYEGKTVSMSEYDAAEDRLRIATETYLAAERRANQGGQQ